MCIYEIMDRRSIPFPDFAGDEILWKEQYFQRHEVIIILFFIVIITYYYFFFVF